MTNAEADARGEQILSMIHTTNICGLEKALEFISSRDKLEKRARYMHALSTQLTFSAVQIKSLLTLAGIL